MYTVEPLLRWLKDLCRTAAPTDWFRILRSNSISTSSCRLHKFIEGRLSSYPQCEIIPAGDLLAAKHGTSLSEVLAAYSGWGAVHGSGGAYTRMALTIMDKVLGGTFMQQQPPPSASDGGSKQKRAESGSFSGGEHPYSSPRRHNSMDNQPGFSRGGYPGSARGGKASFYGSRGGSSSSGSSGDNRFYKYGDRSSGSASGGRSGGSSGYKSRYYWSTALHLLMPMFSFFSCILFNNKKYSKMF